MYYFETPRGVLSLKNFETYATLRLNFLSRVLKCRNDIDEFLAVTADPEIVAASDIFLEGSYKDLISHFTLRLLLANEAGARSFLVQAETRLFQFRLQCMSDTELSRFLSFTEKRLNKIKKSSKTLYAEHSLVSYTQDILSQVKSSDQSWKTVVAQCRENSNHSFFIVPFTVVPHLVAKRIVTVHNGLAAVPYQYLHDVLRHCFELNLVHGVQYCKSLQGNLDKRCRGLKHRLMVMLQNKFRLPDFSSTTAISPLNQQDVLLESGSFPPCMSVLLQSLQTNHQLHHLSRVQLTLFLKEIGMPVQEALQFWKHHYSMAPHGYPHSGGGPKWVGKEKRYTYSIRHLYGLEGSHVNYRAHCCASLQEFIPPCGSNGGCPFKHFDDASLGQLLQREEISDTTDILALRAENQFSCACSLYLRRKARKLLNSQSMCTCSPTKEPKAKRARLENHSPGIHNPDKYSFIGQWEIEHKQCSGDQSEILGTRVGQENSSTKTADSPLMNSKIAADTQTTQNLGKSQRRLDIDESDPCGNVDIQISEKFQNDIDCRLTQTLLLPSVSYEDSDETVKFKNSDSTCRLDNMEKKATIEKKSSDCYYHDLCLSQLTEEKPESKLTEDIKPILKPSEFYISSKHLCKKLKNDSVK